MDNLKSKNPETGEETWAEVATPDRDMDDAKAFVTMMGWMCDANREIMKTWAQDRARKEQEQSRERQSTIIRPPFSFHKPVS